MTTNIQMNRTLPRLATLGLCLALGLSACKNESAPAAANGEAAPTAPTTAGDKVAAEITGAGASFVYPLISKWSADYAAATGNKVNYQSIGSGGGIAQIKAGTVDFGSSDKPLASEELAKDSLVQFPSVIGGVVPVVNLPGIEAGKLRLTGALLADIYLGKVTMWNDAAIAAANPGVALPAEKINVVRRSDGSGTTYNFTNYLSKVSPEWKEKIGEGTAVQWPVGLGGKGNEGVSAFVQRLPGSIGYVEYAYVKQNKMTFVKLKNAAGNTVAPDEASFKAAAAAADWQTSFYQILTNQPAPDAWPITAATYIMLHARQDKPETAAAVLKFFDWVYANGDKTASDLDYVAMPADVKTVIQKSWANVQDGSGKGKAIAYQ